MGLTYFYWIKLDKTVNAIKPAAKKSLCTEDSFMKISQLEGRQGFRKGEISASSHARGTILLYMNRKKRDLSSSLDEGTF